MTPIRITGTMHPSRSMAFLLEFERSNARRTRIVYQPGFEQTIARRRIAITGIILVVCAAIGAVIGGM